MQLDHKNDTTYFNDDQYKSPNPIASLKINQSIAQTDQDQTGFEASISLAQEVLKTRSKATNHSAKSNENKDTSDSFESVELQVVKNLKTKINQIDLKSKATSDPTINEQNGLDSGHGSTPKASSELVENIVHLKEGDEKGQTHLEKKEDVKKVKKGSNPPISLISLTKGV